MESPSSAPATLALSDEKNRIYTYAQKIKKYAGVFLFFLCALKPQNIKKEYRNSRFCTHFFGANFIVNYSKFQISFNYNYQDLLSMTGEDKTAP
jgi:hypothetical protein